jgi:hypothetical protein
LVMLDEHFTIGRKVLRWRAYATRPLPLGSSPRPACTVLRLIFARSR